MKKKKSKKKTSNEERLRRTIQSQRATQGYVVIGNIDRNFIIGLNYDKRRSERTITYHSSISRW